MIKFPYTKKVYLRIFNFMINRTWAQIVRIY